MTNHVTEFAPDLLGLLREHLPTVEAVVTLGQRRPNWVVRVDSAGVFVETQRTRTAETGPQLVPAWMINIAWQRLTSRGRLTHAELVSTKDLNVKRSSFVCAVLARLPGVAIYSTRPIVLTYQQPSDRSTTVDA